MNWPGLAHRLKSAAIALPAALWCVLAGIALLLTVYFRGRSAGKQDERDAGADAAGRAKIAQMDRDVMAGDDAGAQRDAFEGIKPRRP